MYSIIIPTLNEEKYLPLLLADLAQQTVQDFEIIHVDGNSGDKTVEAARQFQHRLPLQTYRIDIRNVSYQRNFGAARAKGKLLIFMDADIRVQPDFLQRVDKVLTGSDAHFFTTAFKPYPDKLIYRLLLSFVHWYTILLQRTAKPFVSEGLFGCRRRTFLELGGFNENVKVNEGSELLERAAAANYRFTIFKSLTHTSHMRRIEKHGVFKSIVDQFQVGLAHLLGIKLSTQKQTKLYPMDGRYR